MGPLKRYKVGSSSKDTHQVHCPSKPREGKIIVKWKLVHNCWWIRKHFSIVVLMHVWGLNPYTKCEIKIIKEGFVVIDKCMSYHMPPILAHRNYKNKRVSYTQAPLDLLGLKRIIIGWPFFFVCLIKLLEPKIWGQHSCNQFRKFFRWPHIFTPQALKYMVHYS